MMGRSIPIRNEAQWRKLRQQHVGGSEVAALFGEHPQISRWELWHRKAGTIPEPDLSANERVFWGATLEPAIARGVAAKTGWTIKKVRRYHSRRPDLALGASLDYEIVAHDRGPGILEIKTADRLVARGWNDGEPPLSYELQVQAYLACTGRSWAAMAVLIGGNELRLFEYERRPKTIAAIEAAVREFWRSIEAGEEPRPEFERDGATIAQLYGATIKGKVVDLSSSNRLPELCAAYRMAADAEKDGHAAKEAARAEILSIIGDAEIAICNGYRISAGAVAGTPDRIITPEMVGQTIKGRAGYRSLRITDKREPANA